MKRLSLGQREDAYEAVRHLRDAAARIRGLLAHVRAVKAATSLREECIARHRADYVHAVQLARVYAARIRAAYEDDYWTAAVRFGEDGTQSVLAVMFSEEGKITEILCEDPMVLTIENLFHNIKVVEARWFDGWVDLS